MTSHLVQTAALTMMRWTAETGSSNNNDDHHEEHFGVHIEYEDLYNAIVFFCCIYLGGQIANLIKMPSLVGEIVVGILLGPPLADFVPNPEAFVLLGEVGLVLLVIEAGIDVDVSSLKLIGTRGLLIAIVGSVLPIAFGIVIAIALNGTGDIKTAIAAGATFGPTSVGVALSILRSGGVLNTPVGQLIISAAVIDDMIALIVLSQLESLKGTIDAASVLIPVVSATLFLVLGGYIALFWVPPLVHKYVHPRFKQEHLGKIELALMFGIVLFMMPATYYAKASYLMGSFVAGLAFCTSHELHSEFVRQLKRVMQWLLRVFFAASIGFQVPIKDLFGGEVLWKGLVFCVALIGKLAVGFMVPNFTQSPSFTGYHLRDCLITGFSMAAEGEFAFVIAVFSVSEGLIDKDLYASVVLAVLLSTIIPPFLLRYTIGHYNKKSAQELEELAHAELERKHDLEHNDSSHHASSNREDQLMNTIKNQTAVFLCIQTQSEGKWGLMHNLMSTLAKQGLEVIDHRAWHPRGIETTLVNEIYAKDTLKMQEGKTMKEVLDETMEELKSALEKAINQENAKVKVQRWYPGVVQEIAEATDEKTGETKTTKSIKASLLKEASMKLTRSQSVQILATQSKSIKEILAGMEDLPDDEEPPSEEIKAPKPAPAATETAAPVAPAQPRRRRQKMRSTPVVGGGLFGETIQEEKTADPFDDNDFSGRRPNRLGNNKSANDDPLAAFGARSRGHRAEITVNGETYDVRLSTTTLKNLRGAYSGDMLGLDDSLNIQPSNDVTTMLQGFVRHAGPLRQITEDEDGETSVDSNSFRGGGSGNGHASSPSPAAAKNPPSLLNIAAPSKSSSSDHESDENELPV